MTTLHICATCNISDTIISRGDRVITRAGIPKAKITTISLADRVIAVIPMTKATNVFAETAVAPSDPAKVFIVCVGGSALLSSFVVRSSFISFCDGDNRRKQLQKIENRREQ